MPEDIQDALYVRGEFKVRISLPYKQGDDLSDKANGMAKCIVDAVSAKSSLDAFDLSCSAETLSVFAKDRSEA